MGREREQIRRLADGLTPAAQREVLAAYEDTLPGHTRRGGESSPTSTSLVTSRG